MKALYKILIFAMSFALGLFLPVLSLMLMTRGCTLQTLGLAFGVYAVAVIAAEVPTGIFADLYGRKTAFLVSCALGAASCALLLFSKSFIAAAGGLVLTGLVTAFASGSADALIVEETLARSGEEGLNKAVSAMRAFEGAGLMVGAVAGGFLPDARGYTAHILARMALLVAVGVFAWIALRETRAAQQKEISLRAHLAGMGRTLLSSRDLLLVLACIAAFAFAQFFLETYWQPRLTALAGAGSQALLGILCAVSFGAAAGGSLVIGKIKVLKSKWRWAAYLSSGAAAAALLFLLSLQAGVAGFAAVYIGVYLVIGMIAVAEQTIVNAQVSDDVRASMLSLTSFTARAGGVASSIVGAALIGGMGIAALWRAGAVFTAACFAAVVLIRVFLRRGIANRQNVQELPPE
jgi:predicted MFS family arabinose efflux permease